MQQELSCPPLAMGMAPTMPGLSPLGPVARLSALAAGLSGLCLYALLVLMDGEPGAGMALACAAPLAAVAALARTSQADRQQYAARLMAALLMLPLLVQMAAWSDDLPVAPTVQVLAVILMLLGHLALFAGVVLEVARLSTRIAPASGVAAVPASVLVARLAALHTGGRQWLMSRGAAPDVWLLERRAPDAQGRLHQVQLCIDDSRAEVRVRERLSAAGARPQNADEASLRNVGDEAVDAARPQAQRVWSVVWQASMLRPGQLAAVRLQLQGTQATAELGADAGPDAWIALLAVLVTRSGLAWQPTLADPAG